MEGFSTLEIAMFVALTICSIGIGYYVTSIIAQADKISDLSAREILDATPVMIWSERGNHVSWSNASFQKLCATSKRDIRFRDFILDMNMKGDEKTKIARLPAQKDQPEMIFELSRRELEGLIVYSATAATRLTAAEEERQRFIQILSETFAHLPVGIAVFDKNRDLSLFNPALVEFLECASSWLAKSPSLRSFLDHLHDVGLLPEPRDYKSWREQIIDMEESATSGTYHEDWYLPNSRVLRVTGRPHPKGSVVFLFEDITRAVSIERDYRVELERYHAVFDSLDAGAALFDQTGRLTFVNHAFDALWGSNFLESLENPDIADLTVFWQSKSQPDPIFGEIRDFQRQNGERVNWSGKIQLKTGQGLFVGITPLPDNSIFVEFSPVTSDLNLLEPQKESA